MLVISRTPLRISFFGGGTDYPAYYKKREGAVIGATIDHYTHISLKTLDSTFFDHTIQVNYSKTERVTHIDQIEHPSIRECLRHKKIDKNVEVHIFSDLPARTGLGSSSSFTVGFLHALAALKGEARAKRSLALEACHVEHNLINENVGSQDQFHAAFGGFNRFVFTPTQVEVHSLVVSPEKRRLLEEHLLLFYTGITRTASELVQEQIEKTSAGENDRLLYEMMDLVKRGEALLVDENSRSFVEQFGALLHEGWEKKKCLSAKISTPLIEEAYSCARRAGALGGKLLGAGGGGFLALMVPKSAQSKVREELREFAEVSYRFEDEGSQIIYQKQ